ERSAGYSFRQLNPTCCPACEAEFKKSPVPLASAGGSTCALCKEDLTPVDEDLGGDLIEEAKIEVDELSTSLQIAKAKLKAAEKVSHEASERLRTGTSRLGELQQTISKVPDDPELVVIQLEAQAHQLRELIASLQTTSADDADAEEDL